MREPPRARQAVRGLKRARARAQLFLAKLTDVLAQHPPPQPSRPAVDLLVAVGQQQEYLLFHNLLPPPGHPGALDALQVFGPHVARWIDGSQAALCGRCRQLEAAAGGVVAHAERLPDGADGARPPRSAPPDGTLQRLSQACLSRLSAHVSAQPARARACRAHVRGAAGGGDAGADRGRGGPLRARGHLLAGVRAAAGGRGVRRAARGHRRCQPAVRPGAGGAARAPPPPPPPPLRPPRHRADPPHTAPLEQWRWLLTHLRS